MTNTRSIIKLKKEKENREDYDTLIVRCNDEQFLS